MKQTFTHFNLMTRTSPALTSPVLTYRSPDSKTCVVRQAGETRIQNAEFNQ